MQKEKKKERNSSFELLRILCIVMVLAMHALGPVIFSLNYFNEVISIGVDSISNIGVTCFILISGYFGINLKAKRFLELFIITTLYSICFFSINILFMNRPFQLGELITSIIPIFANKYWFISCYLALMLLSPFINKMIERMSKQFLIKLLLVGLLLFSIIPTFFYFELTNDLGKGIVNMVLAYMIGRFIFKYYSNLTIKRSKLILTFAIIICTGFLLNLLVALCFHRGGKIFDPFARDCSLFMIAGAVIFFLIFKQLNFNSTIVNKISKSTLDIYILNSFVMSIVTMYVLDLKSFVLSYSFSLFYAIYILLVFGCSYLIYLLRCFLLNKPIDIMSDCILHVWDRLKSLLIEKIYLIESKMETKE